MSQPPTPAGWYTDPNNPQQLRYWDGSAWTTNVAPQPAIVPAAAAAPPQPAAMGHTTLPAAGAQASRSGVIGWVDGHRTQTLIGIGVVLVLIVIGAVRGTSGGDGSKNTASVTIPTGTPSATEIATPPENVLPDPAPAARYFRSCTYLLGDFTSFTSHGFRFIARATIHNTGNVGERIFVKASWVQVGSHDITRSRTVNVPWSKSKVVNFSVPVGQSNIDEIQADNSPNDCHVKATIVSTFGIAFPDD